MRSRYFFCTPSIAGLACFLVLALTTCLAVSGTAQQSEEKTKKRTLSSEIGPADANKYKGIQTAEQWKNPYVVVHPAGLEVRSGAGPFERKRIRVSELAKMLLDLPVAAWPFGRVVAVQEAGLRSGDQDGPNVRTNLKEVEKILRDLDVAVSRWPS